MRFLTLLFFFVASFGLQAQDCEALKQKIDTQQADIEVLQTRMDEASEFVTGRLQDLVGFESANKVI